MSCCVCLKRAQLLKYGTTQNDPNPSKPTQNHQKDKTAFKYHNELRNGCIILRDYRGILNYTWYFPLHCLSFEVVKGHILRGGFGSFWLLCFSDCAVMQTLIYLLPFLLSVNECKITRDCTSNRITEKHTFGNVMRLSGTYSKISRFYWLTPRLVLEKNWQLKK